jgi:hypothetical protein
MRKPITKNGRLVADIERIAEQDISLAASAQAYETALARIAELEDENEELQRVVDDCWKAEALKESDE